jgi:hypothetical protein
MANMSRQSLGDRNLEERGRRADHVDAGHDLRQNNILGKESTNPSNSSLFPPPREVIQLLPCAHYSLRTDGLSWFQEKNIVLRAIDETDVACLSSP